MGLQPLTYGMLIYCKMSSTISFFSYVILLVPVHWLQKTYPRRVHSNHRYHHGRYDLSSCARADRSDVQHSCWCLIVLLRYPNAPSVKINVMDMPVYSQLHKLLSCFQTMFSPEY